MTPVPSRSLLQRACVLISSAALCAALAGCTMGKIQLSGATPVSGQVKLSGKVHGGYGPISGSTIQLWAVGTAGYGSAATPLISSSVTTDANGDWTITGDYTCPSSTTPVYITASGGNAGAGANSAIELAAALGQCGTLSSSTYVWMNEVTTAATAYSLAQYFNTSYAAGDDSFGYPTGAGHTQALTGINNAFATYNNLVGNTTGQAVSTSTLTPLTYSAPASGGTATLTITMTPEASKLNTIADILASCIDSNGTVTYSSSNPSSNTACGTLFGTESNYDGGTQPTDTLQAAVLLNLHPTMSSSDLANLYALQTGTAAPFSGVSTQPTDWTLGIEYLDTSLNQSPSQPTLITKGQNLAIDGGGNIWVLSSESNVGSLVELSPTGVPMDAPQTLDSTDFGPESTTAPSTSPRNMAIDTANDVWLTTSTTGYVFEYNNGMTSGSPVSTGASGLSGPYGLAINGSNDVFVGTEGGSSTGQVVEYPGGDLSEQVTYPKSTSPAFATDFAAFDTNGNLWMDDESSKNFLVELTGIEDDTALSATCTTLNPTTPYPCTLSSATYTESSATGTDPWGISAGASGAIYVGDYDSNAVNYFTAPGSTTEISTSDAFKDPYYTATDGNGNVWVSNRNSGSGSVSEISSTGTVLSPASSSATGFLHSNLSDGYQLGIDPSGNVWIVSNSGADDDAVFEIVGAAGPTVTPIAAALSAGTVGAKP